ncbi:hypothetical protein GE21DRAFT_1128579 [Neurospora crassa]|nr:hypothetical protein GE21DRAFT_1128579 [Neurospora crassa]
MDRNYVVSIQCPDLDMDLQGPELWKFCLLLPVLVAGLLAGGNLTAPSPDALTCGISRTSNAMQWNEHFHFKLFSCPESHLPSPSNIVATARAPTIEVEVEVGTALPVASRDLITSMKLEAAEGSACPQNIITTHTHTHNQEMPACPFQSAPSLPAVIIKATAGVTQPFLSRPNHV